MTTIPPERVKANVLCRLGLHEWEMIYAPEGGFDRVRECRRCGKRQYHHWATLGWENMSKEAGIITDINRFLAVPTTFRRMRDEEEEANHD